jgi:hypothetical protein
MSKAAMIAPGKFAETYHPCDALRASGRRLGVTSFLAF